MYYVIKHTQETEGNTQVIRPHEDKKTAISDFHREIAETLVYPTVKILGVLLIDDYNNNVEPPFRYAEPVEEVTP